MLYYELIRTKNKKFDYELKKKKKDTDKPLIIFTSWLITHKRPILKFYTVMIKNRKAKQAKIKKKCKMPQEQVNI